MGVDVTTTRVGVGVRIIVSVIDPVVEAVALCASAWADTISGTGVAVGNRVAVANTTAVGVAVGGGASVGVIVTDAMMAGVSVGESAAFATDGDSAILNPRNSSQPLAGTLLHSNNTSQRCRVGSNRGGELIISPVQALHRHAAAAMLVGDDKACAGVGRIETHGGLQEQGLTRGQRRIDAALIQLQADAYCPQNVRGRLGQDTQEIAGFGACARGDKGNLKGTLADFGLERWRSLAQILRGKLWFRLAKRGASPSHSRLACCCRQEL